MKKKKSAGLWPLLISSMLLWFTSSTAALPLAHLIWNSPRELQHLEQLDVTVHYVTTGHVIVSGPREVLEEIGRSLPGRLRLMPAQESDVLWLRETHHHRPSSDWTENSDVIATDGRWWALATSFEPELPLFQRPLPEKVAINMWTQYSPSPRLTKAATLPKGLEEVLDGISPKKLAGLLSNLVYLDTTSTSTGRGYDNRPSNLRTRYVLRTQTLDSAATYIKKELAKALEPTGGSVEFMPFKLPTSVFPVDFASDTASFRAQNVIGRLPESDPNAGVWIVCAHYDATASRVGSWNRMTDPAPGADDNASGTVAVLEVARALSQGYTQNGWRWPWTIEFALWSGEELGLIGSRAYADSVSRAGVMVNGVINMDMLGYNQSRTIMSVDAPGSRWITDLLRQTNSEANIGLDLRRYLPEPVETGSSIPRTYEFDGRRSDHASFWEQGYPGVLLIEFYTPDISDSLGAYLPNRHIHTLSDVADSINFDLVAQTTRLVTETVARMSVQVVDGKPDLALLDERVRVSGDGSILFSVANFGDSALSQALTIHVIVADEGYRESKTVMYTARLSAGSTTKIRVVMERPVSPSARVVVTLDPDDTVAESDESNNRAVYPREIPFVIYPNPSDGRYASFRFWDAELGYYAPGSQNLSSDNLLSVLLFVRIYTSMGELVWDNLDQVEPVTLTGFREYRWDCRSRSGSPVASGLYLVSYRVEDANSGNVLADGLARLAISR